MPSRAIRSFSYDASRNELTVTFTTGRGYVYSLVPPEVAAAFAASASRGRFLNDRIRDRYPYRRTTAAPSPAQRPSLRDALAASAEVDEPTPASDGNASRNDESPDRE